jgi:hypothetical protein
MALNTDRTAEARSAARNAAMLLEETGSAPLRLHLHGSLARDRGPRRYRAHRGRHPGQRGADRYHGRF